MDFLLADRVQETTTTTGTGTIALGGAALQARSFVAGIGSGNRTAYCILSGNGIDWETGLGTVTSGSPATLSRDRILASSNSNAAISLTGTSTVFVTAPAASIIQSNRNLLINPGLEIDQLNEGASVALSSGVLARLVDGWQVIYSGAAAGVTAQRVTDAPPGAANSLKVTVGTGAAVGSGDYLIIQQAIEAQELTEAGLGAAGAQNLPVTIQFKSSIAAYVCSIALTNYAGTRSYPLNATISSSGTWTTVTAIVPGDVAGAWVTSGSAGGAYLVIGVAVGSTKQGTVNAWAAGNFYGTSANTNTILSTNGATFQIAKPKLEIGPAPTPLVRRPIAEELIRCQRRIEKSYDLGVALGAVTTAGELLFQMQAGGNAAGAADRFKVTKRATPTMSIYSPATGTISKLRDNVNAADINASGLAAGQSGFFVQGVPTAGTNINFSVQWLAGSDL